MLEVPRSAEVLEGRHLAAVGRNHICLEQVVCGHVLLRILHVLEYSPIYRLLRYFQELPLEVGVVLEFRPDVDGVCPVQIRDEAVDVVAGFERFDILHGVA